MRDHAFVVFVCAVLFISMCLCISYLLLFFLPSLPSDSVRVPSSAASTCRENEGKTRRLPADDTAHRTHAVAAASTAH